MSEYILVVHPLCLNSLKLLKHLYGKGLLDYVDVVSASVGESSFLLDRVVYSVPMLLKGNIVLGIDPLEEEYVEAVITGDYERAKKHVPNNLGGVIDKFTASIRSSSFACALLLYNPAIIDLFIESEFFYGAVRGYYLGKDLVNKYRKDVKNKKNDFMNELLESCKRNVAYNYMRESFLVDPNKNRDQLRGLVIDYERFVFWLQAKISMGRAYTFPELVFGRNRVYRIAESVLGLLENRFDKYFEYLRHEYEVFVQNIDFLKQLGLI